MNTNKRSNAIQWLIEGVFVGVVAIFLLTWAFPEIREARRLLFALVGGTILVYELGRWIADKLLEDHKE
ncbi:MAG: hypothetical protein J4G19_04340 [Pseudomonadales bacterium]|nr:hypothetical protein [Pseudomonadales bacterium]